MYLQTKIKIDFLKSDIYFYIVSDIKKKIKTLLKKRNEQMHDYDGDAAAVTFCLKNADYFIIIKDKYITNYYISHEILHVTEHILNDSSIKDEETKAYIVGYITEKIYNFLISKNIKIA